MLPHENPGLDPRFAQLLKMMSAQGAQASQQPGPDLAALTYEQYQAFMPAMEGTLAQLLGSVMGAAPEGAKEPEQLEVTGADGHCVPVAIFRPSQAHEGALPCVVYLHGGGMGFGSVKVYQPILQRLAELGAVVVAPDFRSSPVARFPGGAGDCLAAAIWARENLSKLGASGLLLAGESGGACLALTVPLLAQRSGLDPAKLFDGIWADAPLCLNPVAAAESPVPSQKELAAIASPAMDLMLRRHYAADPHDPCAFPMNAPAEALRRFPRTAVVVYEFDPLRDEGLAFYRKMLAAGHTEVDCMQIHGLTHCSMVAAATVPGFSNRQLRRMLDFIR